MALMPTFQSILFQAKRSEPEALKCIYITYHPIIFRYVSRHVPYHVAEDVTSDIFLKMVADIYTLRADNEAEFKAWLFAITYTALAAYNRRAEREKVRVVPLDELHDLNSPDDPTMPLLEAERRTAVTGAISMLTTKRRKIVIGRAHGQDYKTLALTTGMKEATARSTHHRTLLWMRDKLAVQIVVVIVVCGIMIGAFLYKVSGAQPGDTFYPVKQSWQQMLNGDDTNPQPTPTQIPTLIPAMLPTPTLVPTPTLMPTVIPAPTLVPTQTTTGRVLNTVATVLPLADSANQDTCVLVACIKSPLP